MLCRLMAQRSRIHRPQIHVEAAHVVMDNVPYQADAHYLQRFCGELGVHLHVLHGSFDASTDTRKTPCFLCAWNRRKILFTFATEQGFNKVALGHHQDDILTTWLMNIAYEGSIGSMQPMLPLQHYPVTVIRPLCLVQEDWIRQEGERLGFERQQIPCPHEKASRRAPMNALFRQLCDQNPETRYSMWQALNKVPGFVPPCPKVE